MQVNVGTSSIDVSTLHDDWAIALMTKGVIVRLNLSRWRATAPLTEEDLGIAFDENSYEFINRYLRLGSEKLLPPEILSELNLIENRARRCLVKYSFETVWGYFVPFSAFEKWSEENEVIQKDFMEAAKQLVNRYDELIDIIRSEYKKLAIDVWKRLYPNGGMPTESFITNFVMKIVAKIPSRERILSSFKYDASYLVIPLPSFIEQDLTEAEKIVIERRKIVHRAKEEMKLVEKSTEIELKTRKKIADEYAKRKKELINSFLDSTVKSMRSNVAELCETILRSLSKCNQDTDIRQNQADKIKRMIEKVELLNFHDDTEIKRLLNNLHNETIKFKGERSREVIVDSLSQLVKLSEEEFLPDFNPLVAYGEV